MLVIRLQRTGRKGHAQFRIIVQDSRRTPTSGAIVASLGSYNPHAKTITLDKEKAATYLTNGAQPSDRVVRLLQAEGVTLPKWVKVATADKQGAVRNADKRRSTRPAEEKPAAEEPPEPAPEETTPPEEAAPEASAETPADEASTEEQPAEKKAPAAEESAE